MLHYEIGGFMSATEKKVFGNRVKPGSKQARMRIEPSKSSKQHKVMGLQTTSVESDYSFFQAPQPSRRQSLDEKEIKIKKLERQIRALEAKLKSYEHQSDSINKVNEVK